MMNLKQTLLGGPIGEIAISVREKYELLSASLFRTEEVGTLANDQLAARLVAAICDPGKTFLDVGAHIGSVISAVKKHVSSAKIVAIEAMPEKASRLRAKFPMVTVHNCAVADEVGNATFYVDTKRSGYSSLVSPGANVHNTREIVVPVKRLDDLFADEQRIDIIKIDIEGAELRALRGADRLLSRNAPVVMFESAPDRSGQTNTKAELFRFFQQRDYAIVSPNRLAHNDNGLSEDAFLEGHLYPRRSTNYFAVHHDRRTEIRDKARRILNIQAE